jgi:hypothetical protein
VRVSFIQTGYAKDGQEPEPHSPAYPVILSEFQLAMYGRGNDHRDADYHGADDNRERDILIVLDLFLDREWSDENDYQKCDRKNNKSEGDKNNGRLENVQQLIKLYDHTQRQGKR